MKDLFKKVKKAFGAEDDESVTPRQSGVNSETINAVQAINKSIKETVLPPASQKREAPALQGRFKVRPVGAIEGREPLYSNSNLSKM